jgi:acyl carrier protein
MEYKKIIQAVKEIIIESLELDIEPEDIEAEDMLLESHLGLDSVATLLLVEALEEEFEIDVEDEELTPELFESVKSLSDFVQSKLNGQTSQ